MLMLILLTYLETTLLTALCDNVHDAHGVNRLYSSINANMNCYHLGLADYTGVFPDTGKLIMIVIVVCTYLLTHAGCKTRS